MKPVTRKNLGAAMLLALLAVLLAEFSSITLPPGLEPGQKDVVRASHFPLTVAVSAYEDPAYSDRLLQSLRAIGLFDRVVAAGETANPDLIAEVERRIDETATAPLLTLLTLGIVPATEDEEWGEVFRLRRPDGTESVLIDFSYSSPTTLGWVASFLNISPERTAGNPRDSLRFQNALAWKICEQSDQIHRLLDATGGQP
jgi:hypothetical protein